MHFFRDSTSKLCLTSREDGECEDERTEEDQD